MFSVQRTHNAFNARQHCRSRAYHYYLPAAALGLALDGARQATLYTFCNLLVYCPFIIITCSCTLWTVRAKPFCTSKKGILTTPHHSPQHCQEMYKKGRQEVSILRVFDIRYAHADPLCPLSSFTLTIIWTCSSQTSVYIFLNIIDDYIYR